MSGQEIAVRDERRAVQLSTEQLRYIAGTEFVPTGLRGNVPAIMAAVATGRELGIGDMVALRSIHIIEGKATLSAELMVQLVRRNGHSITGEVTDGSATVVGKRVDNGDTMKSTWTMDMAARAGLSGKGNWKKYPEAMLWARAVSQLCRMLFADCFAGATYTTEELGAEETGADGVPVLVDDDPRGFPPADLPEPGMGAAVEESDAGDRTPETDAAPLAASPGSPPSGASDSSTAGLEVATDAQQRLILAKASEAGLDDAARHALIEGLTGQPSTKAVPKSMVNVVLAEIERVKAAA